MKISDKQAMMMFDTLKESVQIADEAKVFTWSHATRQQMIVQIINQQSNELINLEGEQEDDDNRNTDIS